MSLPTDSAERKTYPMCSGLLDYFPAALAAVAHHSHLGNEKHNPGEPLHWSRGKSDDHLDCAVRHILERDLEGAAWRILAALQLELEAKGAPVARGARVGWRADEHGGFGPAYDGHPGAFVNTPSAEDGS